MRFRFPSLPNQLQNLFPFRRDNRRPDGTWAAEDATDDNIKGTSVDHYEPVWPRWKKAPPPDFEGEFVSDQGFFDIDEITQTAKFYPPGTPLVDKNLDGNPATRQRVRDFLTGNHWRRRLLVRPMGHEESEGWRPTRMAQGADLIRVQGGPRQEPLTLDLPAPVATEQNIAGTSVDRTNPVWPRWTQTPEREGEDWEFISDEPFYEIDEIEGTVKLYLPGTPLRDTNLGGNPGSRWRGSDSLPGNPFRRRLQVWRGS